MTKSSHLRILQVRERVFSSAREIDRGSVISAWSRVRTEEFLESVSSRIETFSLVIRVLRVKYFPFLIEKIVFAV